jgi:hypothetical protein
MMLYILIELNKEGSSCRTMVLSGAEHPPLIVRSSLIYINKIESSYFSLLLLFLTLVIIFSPLGLAPA